MYSGASINKTVVEANLTYAKAYMEFDSKKGKFTGNKKFLTEAQSNYFLAQALKLQSQCTNYSSGKVDRR